MWEIWKQIYVCSSNLIAFIAVAVTLHTHDEIFLEMI